MTDLLIRSIDRDSTAMRRQIRQLPSEVIPYSRIYKLAFNISSALPITQYDACFLSVAIEFNQKVITADKRFFKGMRHTPYHNFIFLL